MNVTRVARTLSDASGRLDSESPRTDAELLLARALDRPRSWLYAHADAAIDAGQLQVFQDLLERRRSGEPLAYILGEREFWSLPLAVSEHTLIPRPETELLVELALACLPPDDPLQVLDLGTGSGAIALALASERPLAQVTAVDADADTLAVARGNAARLGLERVRFLQGDWFSPVAGLRFELVIGNPPYLAEGDPHLDQGDLRFEPRAALVSGSDGLAAIRHIVRAAPRHMKPGASLLLEHGFEQGAAVRALFEAAGFDQVRTSVDLEGRDRVTAGRIHRAGA